MTDYQIGCERGRVNDTNDMKKVITELQEDIGGMNYQVN